MADDHQLFRAGFASLINSYDEFETCRESPTGHDVLSYIKENSVDLITLDLGMPEFPDTTILNAIKKINADIKILVISMHDEISVIKQTIRQGADGYLTKDTSTSEVYAALTTIIGGEKFLPRQISQKLIFSNHTRNSKSVLSSREIEILKMITSEGLSLVEISKKLKISAKTVTTHKSNIMIKLETTTNLGLIKAGQKLLG